MMMPTRPAANCEPNSCSRMRSRSESRSIYRGSKKNSAPLVLRAALGCRWSMLLLLLLTTAEVSQGFVMPTLDVGTAQTGRGVAQPNTRLMEAINTHASSSSTWQPSSLPSLVTTGRGSSQVLSANKNRVAKGKSSLSPSQGLSKFHQSILAKTRTSRQAIVTGRDPVTLSVKDSPTLKWLTSQAAAAGSGPRPSTLQLHVNGTVLEKSTASLERFLWLHDGNSNDDDGWGDEISEVSQQSINARTSSHDYFSMEWVAEVHLERPGYIHILPRASVASSIEDKHQTKPQWSWHKRLAAADPYSSWQEEAANRLSPSSDDEDVLVCTGFSLARRKGLLATLDTEQGHILRSNDRTRSQLLWPNEVTLVPQEVVTANPIIASTTATRSYRDALLVSDGFLVPGKDRGGLYLVQHAGNPHKEWTVRLTSSASSSAWFYHKSVWMDMTGDGRQSILTARCRVTTKLGGGGGGDKNKAGLVTTGITQQGQLVWLEAPKPHSYDPTTGTPLEADGTVFDPFASRHLPWKEHVLATGPDVMFCVADLDPEDDCVEIIASQFFDKSVQLYSIQKGPKPRVVFQRDIDTQCGAAFASVLADLDQEDVDNGNKRAQGPTVVDAGSTVPSLRPGDTFSHLLVTSHECTYAAAAATTDAVPACGNSSTTASPSANAPLEPHLVTDRSAIDGGSVFAYRIPTASKDAWKTEPWIRTTVATGFAVRGQLGNVINPGAPGFCYTFPARQGDGSKRPLLAVAGDCAESAYVFRPVPADDDPNDPDPSTRYKLMVEIECESTVGSIGVGYGNFLDTNPLPPEESDRYANLYIPCYEKDKILVFALGSGEDLVDAGW